MGMMECTAHQYKMQQEKEKTVGTDDKGIVNKGGCEGKCGGKTTKCESFVCTCKNKR